MQQFVESCVLVVEDDVLIGLDICATLEALGCLVIGPIATVRVALQTLGTNRVDAALLDINLGADLSYPIADALMFASIPFLFLSAYSRAILPYAYRDRDFVAKPCTSDALVRAVTRLLRSEAR
jgi:two-component SAPR family response regulator